MFSVFRLGLLFISLSLALFAEEKEPFVAGQNQFSWNLLQQIGDIKGNVCISPYNISSAMQLVYFGAASTTKSQIGQALHLPKMSDTALAENIVNFETKIAEDVANAKAVAVDTTYTVAPAFLDIVKGTLKADLFTCDFQNKPEQAVASINKWVSSKTEEHIQQLLERDNIKSTTRLVLLSAIYLKADWLFPFDEKSTKESPFRALNGSDITVPMMYQKETMLYHQDSQAQVVWRDFEKHENSPTQLQAMIVLPSINVALDTFVKGIDSAKVGQWEKESSRELVALYLPKCSLKQRQSVKNSLISLGMTQAFSNAANLSVISPKLDITIDDVLHEAFMQLDEKGVIAAGATGVIIGLKSVMEPPKKEFVMRCDRPYLVVIREKESGLVLFVSVVASPEKIEKKNLRT